MKFNIDEMVILNEKAQGLPNNIGELVTVRRYRDTNSTYDMDIELPNGDIVFAKESELNKLTDEQKALSTYVFTGNRVLHKPSGEVVKIVKCDYIHKQIEVEFDDGAIVTVMVSKLEELKKESESVEESQYDKLGKFTKIGLEIGDFTDIKNKQYGSSVDATYKMLEVLMERYTYDDENYLMPKSLLQHILLQVRMMDKINRIFNNPSGEGDSESPYRDLAGYSLMGVEMTESNAAK